MSDSFEERESFSSNFFSFSRRWSNVNRPGQWVFQVGPISDEEDIKVPDNVEGKIIPSSENVTSHDSFFLDDII